MRHNLIGAESKGSKKIEFTYDPEQLPIFHHRKRIEVMLLEQPREFAHCSLPIHGHHGSRHKLFNRASDEAVHPFVSLSFRLHSFVSCLWLTLGTSPLNWKNFHEPLAI
jgi:hypothetical protein